VNVIPVSGRFFAAVTAYLDAERPPGTGSDRVFLVLKGPRRGRPLSAKGMDEILAAARRRRPAWARQPATSCAIPA
jgi:integrase/recombinase XerD